MKRLQKQGTATGLTNRCRRKQQSIKEPSPDCSCGKIKTPDTHPNEFEKERGSGNYRHKETGWRYKPDRFHKDGHWDVSPPNGKVGDYYNVYKDGRIR